ncbi:MAG: hypothetical protein LBQ98_10870, partial [Nitrososphaerota archaeon]|nr:hypothetical protein [Nitrososphaerota archaeon]
TKNMKTNTPLLEPDAPIHNYDQRLTAYKRIIQSLPNGKTALCFLNHLSALNLSTAGPKQAFCR